MGDNTEIGGRRRRMIAPNGVWDVDHQLRWTRRVRENVLYGTGTRSILVRVMIGGLTTPSISSEAWSKTMDGVEAHDIFHLMPFGFSIR